MFLNFFLNAMDAMNRGGELRVQTEIRAGDEWMAAIAGTNGDSHDVLRVTIRDNGEGIRTEDIPHVFDPFFTTKESGTGLGLSVVHGIIQEHGGHTKWESELKKGTAVIFCCRCPLCAGGGRGMIPSPVCIVYSQEADLARRVKGFLSAMAQVRHVSSPDRLDAVLQQNSPAILILDLRGKDARDLLDQIQVALPEVLIIALGTLRSDPLREVEQSGIYAAEDLQIDRRRLQALVSRGFDHLRVLQENRDLRDQPWPHLLRTVTPR